MIDYRVGLLIAFATFFVICFVGCAFRTKYTLDENWNIRCRTNRENIKYAVMVIAVSFILAVSSYFVYMSYTL